MVKRVLDSCTVYSRPAVLFQGGYIFAIFQWPPCSSRAAKMLETQHKIVCLQCLRGRYILCAAVLDVAQLAICGNECSPSRAKRQRAFRTAAYLDSNCTFKSTKDWIHRQLRHRVHTTAPQSLAVTAMSASAAAAGTLAGADRHLIASIGDEVGWMDYWMVRW